MVILLFGGRRSVRIHWKEVSHNFKACLSCILHSDMSDRQRRFKMYHQEMTRLIHAGYLGIGNRKQLPQCLTNGIQDAFPNNPQEAYVGLRFKIIILFAYINSKQASLLLSSYGRSSEPTKKGTKSWWAIRRHKTVIECQLGHRGDHSADTSMWHLY